MRYFFPEINCLQNGGEAIHTLYDGDTAFNSFRVMERNQEAKVISTSKVKKDFLNRFISRPNPTLGLNFETPIVMGILNVTPDSFYDGEDSFSDKQFVEKGLSLLKTGCSILDVGGESTRPGAREVAFEEEIERVVGVIKKIKKYAPSAIISVDTRKAIVAEKALQAGASIVNDISAGSFDEKMFNVVAKYKAGVCLMHSDGLPENMQDKPYYENVILDIYDYLEKKINEAQNKGISREKIMIDPGIGFGKSFYHNIEILKKISLLLGLGCPLMVGLSRKSFIGEITNERLPAGRLVGSIAAMLKAKSNGVNIFRVHDVKETADAIKVWNILK